MTVNVLSACSPVGGKCRGGLVMNEYRAKTTGLRLQREVTMVTKAKRRSAGSKSPPRSLAFHSRSLPASPHWAPPHQELCWVKCLKVKRIKRGRQLNWLVCSLLPQQPQTWVERAEYGRNSDLDMGKRVTSEGSGTGGGWEPGHL